MAGQPPEFAARPGGDATVAGIVMIIAVALLVGFRPNATAVEWVAVLGVLVMISFALTWLSVAHGLEAKNIESASNIPMSLVFLPFLSSGFAPTDPVPAGLRAFAGHQPFTRSSTPSAAC